MAYDEKLFDRVKAALGDSPYTTKKMFGGITFMVRGKMCVSVGKDRIMCRIDPSTHEQAIQQPGCRTVKMKGREYKGYVHVDAVELGTRREVDRWVKRALQYNERTFSGK